MVLYEGETEEDYLKHVRRVLRHHQIKIELFNETGRSPLYYVKQAIQERNSAARKGSPFDEVWCVFDVDNHADLAEALSLAKAKGVHVALSSPSFELWLLWHFEDNSAHISQTHVERRLRPHLPGYSKRLLGMESRLEGGSEAACRRASQLARKHEGDGSPEFANPSSRVGGLVESVRDSLERFHPGSTAPYP